MASNKNQSPRAGNQGGTHEQHVQAGRQSHKNDASRQSDSLSNQQSGSRSGSSQQSGNQSNSSQQSGNQSSASQQSGRQSNGSQQSGARSGAGVQGGTPEQHAAAGRQSHKNDKNR